MSETTAESESREELNQKSLAKSFMPDLSPLRASREYRLLYAGQFVSSFGSAISYVVLPWQLYQLTKSTVAVGMLGIVEFVPMFALSFVGGVLADYIDRRRLILLTEIGLALCCGILILNSLFAQPKVSVLFVIAGIFAAFSAVHRPAIESLTPRIVPLEKMPAVAALNSLRYNFNHIIGPSLAGAIAASFGAATAFSIDLLTYLASVITLLLMRSVPPAQDADRPGWRSIVDGLRYARSRQELLGTYLIDLNAMFFGMPLALFPAIADRLGQASLGLLYAMISVGALLSTLTSGWTHRVRRHGLAVAVAATVWGVAIIGFGLTSHLLTALFFLVLAGAADNISGIFRMTIWNQTIPDHLRGRMAGIEMVSYLTGPYLGNAEAGLVAGYFGLQFSIVSGGILCVLGCGVLAALLPKFIRYDGREGLARRLAEDAERTGRSSSES